MRIDASDQMARDLASGGRNLIRGARSLSLHKRRIDNDSAQDRERSLVQPLELPKAKPLIYSTQPVFGRLCNFNCKLSLGRPS